MFHSICRITLRTVLIVGATACAIGFGTVRAALPYPILFVTQFPIPDDFATIGSVFANHRGTIEPNGRGGDLWIRYPDGSMRNLTNEAGFGSVGMQGANVIGVRDPEVHWSGAKAIFSMVVGAPVQQYVRLPWYWQLYEVTGLAPGQTAVITKVANQPLDFNNVEPAYASDDSIIFGSDRPRDGRRHLYPQQDEYESTPTPTGLWKLIPATGALSLMQHSPSGSFNPIVDSFGRVLFTRWDHLQRDQQADVPSNLTFNWASEEANAPTASNVPEVFPEPRIDTTTTHGMLFNQFFPWQVNQDGSGEETLNHIGRHELASYFVQSFFDPALREFIAGVSGRTNPNDSEMWLQLAEDPQVPGRYLAINAPEFYTHASGQIVAITAPLGANANDLSVQFLTPRSTRGYYAGAPPTEFSGHYRNPLPLSDGQLIAAHTSESRLAGNDGSRAAPNARYKFRLKRLVASNGNFTPVENLTPGAGITKTISYWDPDVMVSYNGPLWELSPVEVRPRPVPPTTGESMAAPEVAAFAAAGVSAETLRAFLRQNSLALLVSRNVTTRDAGDRQQPFNLSVPGGTQTTSGSGMIYPITQMQFYQGDQVRGIGGAASPDPGRRVLAQVMHDPAALAAQPQLPGVASGAAKIAADGSIAAFVPARRAMTWELAGSTGDAVVRERYWITAQPGEIRACDGCHGVNRLDQASRPPAQNTPQALIDLLVWWRDHNGTIFKQGFENP
ncbi:MAG: hypothetical protein ABIR16_07835 [Dokdonella sp.]